MKTQLTSIILSMSALTLCAQDKKPAAPPAGETAKDGVKHVDAAAAKKLIDESAGSKDAKLVVLDIRTPEEFKAGHIAGAKNVDFLAKDFAEKAGALDKNATFLVHCQSGGRSTRSLETLRKLGFKSIVHMDGGFSGWKKAGLPVEK